MIVRVLGGVPDFFVVDWNPNIYVTYDNPFWDFSNGGTRVRKSRTNLFLNIFWVGGNGGWVGQKKMRNQAFLIFFKLC